MKFALTKFAAERHFDSKGTGTIITDRTFVEFATEVNEHIVTREEEGEFPFSRLFFFPNWTNARASVRKITPKNEHRLKSGYFARTDGELPVLCRWFDRMGAWAEDNPSSASCLCVVCYNKEQLAKEGTKIEADWGIVALLGLERYKPEPMAPMTILRNSLGVAEGGNGVALDRTKYLESVKFWDNHAKVRNS